MLKNNFFFYTRIFIVFGFAFQGVRSNGESTSQEKHRPKAGAAHVLGVVGQAVQLPCELTPLSPTDSINLVLWYRDLFGTPIYSYDLRDGVTGAQKHWVSKSVFGDRAFFHVLETGDVTQTGAKILRSYLEINEAISSDAGPYRCRVDFAQAPTRNAKIMLSLIELPTKPSIYDGNNGRITDRTPLLNINETIDLKCESNGGSPVPHMSWWWRRPGSREMPLISESTSVHGSYVSSRLRFPPVQRDDNGTIIGCAVSNTNLTKPITTSFAIDILLNPLEAKVVDEGETFIVGQIYNVSCQVLGSNPLPNIKLSVNQRNLKILRFEYDSRDDISTATAEFEPEVGDHGKLVKCLGQNPRSVLAQVEDQRTINVQYLPQIDLIMIFPRVTKLGREDVVHVAIQEGEEVEMNCTFIANPEVTEIDWFQNGKPISESKNRNVYFFDKRKQLKIRSLARDNEGSYSCQARNDLGIGTSNLILIQVQYPPECTTNRTLLRYVAIGESVTLTCRVDASPSQGLAYTWTLYNNNNNSINSIKPEVNTIQLTSFDIDGIQSVLTHVPIETDGVTDGFGLIECKAENSVGQQRDGCKFQIKEKVFPELEECHLVKSTPDSVTLSCHLLSQKELDVEFRVDLFSVMTSLTTDSEFRQLVFVDAEKRTKNDFILPIVNLRSNHRYRLTILAIDRQSRASSKKPFTIDFKTEKNVSNQRQQRPTLVRISTLPPPTTSVATSKAESTTKIELTSPASQISEVAGSTTATTTTMTTTTSVSTKQQKTNLGLESNQKSEKDSSQTLPVLGFMCGTIALILLVSVLVVVVKRNRTLPVPVGGSRGSNPQTPTHVSFSTNIDNPPEIKIHRRKIEILKQDALDDTNSETEKLNDVHFGGFSDLASEQIYSQSLNLKVDHKQQSEYVTPVVSNYEVPVGSLCIIDEWDICQPPSKVTENDVIANQPECLFVGMSNFETQAEDTMALLLPTPIEARTTSKQQQQQQPQQQLQHPTPKASDQ